MWAWLTNKKDESTDDIESVDESIDETDEVDMGSQCYTKLF